MFVFKWRFRCRCRRCCLSSLLTIWDAAHAWCDYALLSIRAPKWQTAFCKTSLLAGQTRNASAANLVAAVILIACRYVKQLRLANEILRIPEDTISMSKITRIWTCSLCSSVELRHFISKWKISFFSSQNSDLNNHLALCFANNDNEMTFVGHIVPLGRKWCYSGHK